MKAETRVALCFKGTLDRQTSLHHSSFPTRLSRELIEKRNWLANGKNARREAMSAICASQSSPFLLDVVNLTPIGTKQCLYPLCSLGDLKPQPHGWSRRIPLLLGYLSLVQSSPFLRMCMQSFSNSKFKSFLISFTPTGYLQSLSSSP